MLVYKARTCRTCNGPIKFGGFKRWDAKHCSGKCRQKAYRDRMRELIKVARGVKGGLLRAVKRDDELERALSFNGRLAGKINTRAGKRNATPARGRRGPGRPRGSGRRGMIKR